MHMYMSPPGVDVQPATLTSLCHTLPLIFFTPGACYNNMSDWPFELSEKLSKGWEDLGRFQKPG